MPMPPVFHRSPRLIRRPPTDVITLPALPALSAPPENPMLTAVIPLASAIVIGGVLLLSGVSAAWWPGLLIGLIGAATAALGALSSYWIRLRSYRRHCTERVERYHSELAQLEHQLVQLQEQQRVLSINNDPSPETCLAIVQRRQRQLWNRAPGDGDFLKVRVGLGAAPASFSVNMVEQSPLSNVDPLMEKAADLRHRYAKTAALPISVSLNPAEVLGIVGARPEIVQVASLLIMQLATHHAPDRVKIAAIFPANEQESWAWMRWLPHTWNEDRSFRYLASNATDANELLVRIAQGTSRNVAAIEALDPVGFTSDNVDLVFFVAAPATGEMDRTLRRLISDQVGKNICIVFLTSRVRQLPPECTTIVRVALDVTEVIYQSDGKQFQTQMFELDKVPPGLFDEFARALAPVRLAGNGMERRIGELTWLDLYGGLSVERLNVNERWQGNGRSSTSLSVPIGMTTSGKLLSVDLHEKADGPHALVAGMAGSGKSELLQTLTLSLALNYPPHRVAFVLIDYKGGGTANLLAALPHTLGVITNLQEGELAQRAITSLRAEAVRRQRLFAEVGVNHIDAYQHAYDTGETTVALPYLLIVVDEFAELKTEQPEIAREFVRIARIGRSLGFRLLLAMQKPTGVVDEQIEANMRLRICLRVAQIEDSQAMLRRPDAAYLIGTGSALLRVGVERFEQFQVGWAGAPYYPGRDQKQAAREIVAVELNGYRRVLTNTYDRTVVSVQMQIEAVVFHIRQIVASTGIAPVTSIWLPPLPPVIDLSHVRGNGGWDGKQWTAHTRWLEPAIGLVDRPDKQRQDKLAVDLARTGQLVVYGSARTGKTTLLQTLVTALALDHPPDLLHIYIIEPGNHQLKSLAALPHVGDVIGPKDHEGMLRLLRMISDELHRRQQLLAQRPMANEALFPAIILVVDGYENLSRLSGELSDELTARIQSLAHGGRDAGIYLVLTANHPLAISFAFASTLGQTLVLQMVEQSDYALILGASIRTLPDTTPGRGIVRVDAPAIFQVALPATALSEAERSRSHLVLMESIAATWAGAKPAPAPRLPEYVALSQLSQPSRTSGRSLAVALGLYVDSLRPIVVDLGEVGSVLIAGAARSGKSTLLRTWATALMGMQPPELLHIYVIDSARRTLATLADVAHVKAYTTTPTASDKVLQELQALIDARLQSTYHQMPESMWPAVVILVDDLLDPFDDGTSEAGKQLLTTLLRQGRRLDIYTLVASTVGDLAGKGWGEPAKTLKESQKGFLLSVAEDAVFGARLPDYGRSGPVKPGDGFFVLHTSCFRVRLAISEG